MKKEELTALGLTEEQANAVYALNGKDVNAVRAELDTANNTIKSLQETVKQYDGVDIDKLKTAAGDWEKKYNDDIAALKLNYALESALIGAKARDVKAVKPFIDMGIVKLDGDKVIGLEEQLKSIREAKGFLFEDEVKTPFRTGARQIGTEGQPDKKEEANDALRAMFGKGE